MCVRVCFRRPITALCVTRALRPLQTAQPIPHAGTLSKAVGALGGFVACSSQLRALLLNRGRSVVFSTALPVPVVAGAQAALEVAARCVGWVCVDQGASQGDGRDQHPQHPRHALIATPQRVQSIKLSNSTYSISISAPPPSPPHTHPHRERWRQVHLQHLMRLVSTRLGVPVVSPIIPLVVGSEATALALSRQMLSAGFHVPAIRPPTVAPGTCRLRLSLSAGHSVQQVEALCDALQAALARMPGGVTLQSLPHLVAQQQEQQQQLLQSQSQQQPQERSRSGSSGTQPQVSGMFVSAASGGRLQSRL